MQSALRNAASEIWSSFGFIFAAGSGGTQAASDNSMLARVAESGWNAAFDAWTRGDTFTVIGIVLSAVSVWIAYQSVAIRREELEYKKSMGGK